MVVQKNIIDTEIHKRMKRLKLHGNVWKDYVRGILNKSENPYGALFHLTQEEKEKVKEIEKEYDITVYHVISHKAEFGQCFCMLYVDNDASEFEYDNELLDENCTYAYVWNRTEEICSEFGTIGIMPRFGGVIRVE